MARIKRPGGFNASVYTLVMLLASGAKLTYADGFESQLLDDLIPRAAPQVPPAPQADAPPAAPGPLAAVAEDMHRAAEAMRGRDADDWDAAVAAQDAAIAKLRRLLEGVDAASGRLQVVEAAQEQDSSSAPQARAAGDLPPAAEERGSNPKGEPGSPADAPPRDDATQGEGPSGGPPSEPAGSQGNVDGPGHSPGQSGGSAPDAGGGTAAAAARDEAAEVRLHEAAARLQRMQWGMLPPRLREQVGGGGEAEFAEGYERPTAAYFEELSRRLGDRPQ